MKRRVFLSALAALGALPLGARAQAKKPMKIGVIGSGRIGSTIGGLWAKAGHEVMFSDRDPEAVKRAVQFAGARARGGSPREAAAFGEVVLIAVPYAALPAVGKEVGEQLKGKIVIDPNNPVPSRDGEMAIQAQQKGAALSTAALLPGIRQVRAFNNIGWNTFQTEAHRPAPRMGVLIAADDATALKVGMQLVQDAGFDPVHAGSLADSKAFDLGSPLGGPRTADELRKALPQKP
jgi:8-hydroxy-5-deazaflavin:NADPH oxidoreductase